MDRCCFAEKVAAGVEQAAERHQPDQLRAGDSHAARGGGAADFVERDMDRRDAMSVRFIDTCAMPYSGMNQPIALTALSVPGSVSSSPRASSTALPSASRMVRPASRTSKAMALARRVDVVLRLTL